MKHGLLVVAFIVALGIIGVGAVIVWLKGLNLNFPGPWSGGN